MGFIKLELALEMFGRRRFSIRVRPIPFASNLSPIQTFRDAAEAKT